MHRALTHMHQANRLTGIGGDYRVRKQAVRAGQGEGRCTGTHVQGHGKTRGQAGRPEPGMHKQILSPSPVRPEAAQPAADSPAPHAMPPRQALLSGGSWGHAKPHQCHVPLEVSCRGSACGRCSCLSLGRSAADCTLLPCGQHRGDALRRGWELTQQGEGKG